MTSFSLEQKFPLSVDQKKASEQLLANLKQNEKYQILLGVTGSGKTYTMANVITQYARPTLVLTHNKTLAAQLYREFKEFFPHNAVEYFVSYYDYYQPEAYVPGADLYIAKDSSTNDELDKMRLSATRSLFEREDVIIVSSVSCIYGLGSPEAYSGMLLYLMKGQTYRREDIIKKLVEIQYRRNEIDFHRGTFRLRGDVIDIYPAYDDIAYRISLFDEEVETIHQFDPLTGKVQEQLTKVAVYPSSHYVAPPDEMPETLQMIAHELDERLAFFQKHNKLLEAQRLEQRTQHDIELLAEGGTCPGVENYSRIMRRGKENEPPPTLLNYFPKDSLLLIDESHVSLPQISAMYKGDRARKLNLVDYGFRLPSALDNRPLKYEEFEKQIDKCIYISATPGKLELEHTDLIAEQIIRPTGLLDPLIEIRPTATQVDDMYGEIQKRIKSKERVLITTLTKRMAEDLCEYYENLQVKVKYLHSDIDTIERSEILRSLRSGEIDVLIGINLLREGLDLPEVSLVGIFDADKEGFLRSARSLLQTCGRAARNVNGRVIMFADKITASMQTTIDETTRRRAVQDKYNKEHNITPQTIIKSIPDRLSATPGSGKMKNSKPKSMQREDPNVLLKRINDTEKAMYAAANDLDFERATILRDELKKLQEQRLIQ